AGHWSGRMEPTHLSAEIELDLQRADGSWKAGMTFRAGPDGGSLPIEQVRVDGDSVFVSTKIEGADALMDRRHDGVLLLGVVRIMENGRVIAEGRAGLARASDPDGKERLARWLDAQGAPI